MLKIFFQGGLVMYSLLICSLLALTIVVERVIFYVRNQSPSQREITTFKTYLKQGKLDEAKKIIARWESSLGRVAVVAVRQWESTPEILECAIEAIGIEELQRVQRGLNVLDSIVTASPLLGLLGTVFGIIKCFTALSVVTSGQNAGLSLGIAEALYNTAFGLVIAIPALFCVSIFYNLAEQRVQELNLECQELMTIHKRPGDFVEASA